MRNVPKERGLLCKGEMVRAILDNRKTQTRRLCPVPVRSLPHTRTVGDLDINHPMGWRWKNTFASDQAGGAIEVLRAVSPFRVGQRLWIKETFYCDHCFVGDHKATCNACVRCSHTDEDRIASWRKLLYYRADGEPDFDGERVRWTSPLLMPRWASRITLEITNVRVEPLQDISVADIESEGLPPGDWYRVAGGPEKWFESLWDNINDDKAPWRSNPMVYVVEFQKVDTASQRKAS